MTTTAPHPRSQRGTTLVEVVVAFAVMAFGMLAVSKAQTQMRQHAESSRHQSEAVRLAQEEIESMRAYSVVTAALDSGAAPDARSYDGLATASRMVDSQAGYRTNARYLVQRQVDVAGALRAKPMSVTVGWLDRSGAAREVALHSWVAEADPAHSAALALVRGDGSRSAGRPLGRSSAIPAGAKDLGNGTSAFKPVATGTLAIVFDNLTGRVTQRCDRVDAALATRDLSAAALGACAAHTGLLLSGHVRYTAASPPDASRANDAPLAAGVAITLSGAGYDGAPECSAEPMKTVVVAVAGSTRREAVPLAALPASYGLAGWADSGERFLSYHCLVPTRADRRWSGRSVLVANGWSIGSGPGERRVCRYSSDQNASGAVDANIGHPARYVDVDAALPQQNFLVINGTDACPAGGTTTMAGLRVATAGTAAHQP